MRIPRSKLPIPALVLLLPLLLSCGDKAATDDDTAGDEVPITWQAHPCGNGDPVSQSCEEGVGSIALTDPDWPTCDSLGVGEGEPCSPSGDQCVLVEAEACEDAPEQPINSAAYLWCRAGAFPDQECPQSTAAAKEGVSYLEDPDRTAISDEVLGLRFARYRYKEGASEDRSEQLGMIIEDAPDAVFIDGQRINLYAYASALAVTVQEQDARIRALEARLAALEAAPSAP